MHHHHHYLTAIYIAVTAFYLALVVLSCAAMLHFARN